MSMLSSLPTRQIGGEFVVPGDKSITQRAFIFASIARGNSLIRGALLSSDCLATLNACNSLGVQFVEHGDGLIELFGVGKDGLTAPQKALDLENSGTGIRLLTGLLCAQRFDSTLIGDESLSKRPMQRVLAPLSEMGAEFSCVNWQLPIHIKGNKNLSATTHYLKVASAQVKSALMLASLYADSLSQIIEPVQTRDHSELLFKSFNADWRKEGKTHFVSPHTELTACEISIPGDFSSAAFFIAAAALAKKGELCIRGVGLNPTRVGFLSLIRQMGAHIECCNERYLGFELVCDLFIKNSSLQAITVDKSWVPLAIDEYPLLFLLATQAKGESVFSGLAELRVKESNRLEVMKSHLQQMGASVSLRDDELRIKGGGLLQGGEFDCYGDHRIAMTLTISSLVSEAAIKVTKAQSIKTSFPEFVSVANSLGMNIVTTEEEQECLQM